MAAAVDLRDDFTATALRRLAQADPRNNPQKQRSRMSLSRPSSSYALPDQPSGTTPIQHFTRLSHANSPDYPEVRQLSLGSGKPLCQTTRLLLTSKTGAEICGVTYKKFRSDGLRSAP